MGGYANLESIEGNIAGTETISLVRRPRQITILNDSSVNNLKFKFADSAEYATLKPTEMVSMEITPKRIILNGNCPYRIWGIG